MNNEEKFKDHLKSQLDSKQFEFDEANWEKASKMLDERKKRRAIWPYFLLLGVFIGSGLTYVLLQSDKIVSVIDVPAVEERSANTKPITSTTEETPSDSKPETKKPLSVTKIKSVVIPTENVVSQKKNTFTTLEKNGIVTTPETEASPITQSPSEKKSEEPTLEPNTSAVSIDITEDITKSNQTEAINLPPTDEKKESVTASSPALVAVEEASLTPTAEVGENLIASQASVSATEKVIPASAETATTETIANQTVVAMKADSNGTKNNSSEQLRNPILSIEAGASFLFGWKSNSSREAMGLNPVIGINYHNKITNDLDYSLGMQFTTMRHLSGFSDTSKVTTYKTGEESDVTVITPQTLYYLSLPFKVSKSFNKNTFGLGANLAYLITSNSKVDTYHQSTSISEQTSGNEMGYTQGFSNYNFELTAFYRRRLYKNLSLNAEFVFGLTDLRNNDFFKTTTTERSSGFKLTLLYGLLNR